MKAYFQYINEEKGGVNGRQLTWISYDDGYDPAKALANVRRAIEQDTSFLVAFDLGTPMAQAVLPYLTDKGVPYFLPGTSASNFDDPKQYPTLIMAGPSYYANSKVLGIYVAQTFPGKKIGMLQQNGDPGPDFANGFKDGLGDRPRTWCPSRPPCPAIRVSTRRSSTSRTPASKCGSTRHPPSKPSLACKQLPSSAGSLRS